jgi:hypothetical protein
MIRTCVAVSTTLPSSPARTAERGSHPAPALVTGGTLPARPAVDVTHRILGPPVEREAAEALV